MLPGKPTWARRECDVVVREVEHAERVGAVVISGNCSGRRVADPLRVEGGRRGVPRAEQGEHRLERRTADHEDVRNRLEFIWLERVDDAIAGALQGGLPEQDRAISKTEPDLESSE